MVPREAGRGGSFKGAGMYYLHDRGADTSERVAFTHTENVPTNDPHKAVKWMAWTAMNAEELKRQAGSGANGRACSKPVFTFSLAWHPEEEPKKWEMIGAGRRALVALGLQEHETVMVSHSDRAHPHLHLIVNVVHPETGKASSLSYSRIKLSKWAENYERERGKIYCDQRVENNARREKGEKVKYREPQLDLKARITKLYNEAESAEEFQAALGEQGFTLAQGKRIVLIDRDGAIHSLYRQIEGAKAKDIKAKLAGLDLPLVDDARGQIEKASGERNEQAKQESKQQPEEQGQEPPRQAGENVEPVCFDRDRQDREWQESIIEAAIKAEQEKGEEPPAPAAAPPHPSASPQLINALQDRHHAELGRFYTENTQARLKLDFTLDQQYGAHERQLRSEIAHLENVLNNSGWFRLFCLKLTGQVPRNPEEHLDNMRKTLENVEWRKEEAQQGLEAGIARNRQEIEARQMMERQQLQPAAGEALQSEPMQPEPTHDSVQISDNPGDSPGDQDEDFGPSFD